MALDTLRKGASRLLGMILLFMLVVSFGIWGIADIFRGYGAQTLIQVGDKEISAQDYMQTQREILREMSADAGRSLSLQEARDMGLDNRLMERLVGGAAVDNHAKSLGLGISQSAITDQITKAPDFQDKEGQFSPAAFAQALQNLNMTEQGFLASQREHDLRRQLVSTVGKNAATPQVLVDALTRYNDETRTLRYVVVPQSAAGTAGDPTDDQLKSYYDNHHSEFTQPEYRKLGVLAVTPESVKDQVQISDDDLKAAYDKEKDKLGKPERRHVQQITFKDQASADAAYQKIQSGTDFGQVAKDQGLSDADIDLGTLAQNEFADSAVADAAFKLDKDKVSEPVKGALGNIVLIRVTEIQPGETVTFDQAKPELEKKILNDRAQRVILDLSDKIEDERAAGAKLSEVADKFKLKYQVVDQVNRSGHAPDGADVNLPGEKDLLDAAFVTDTGVENDPLEVKDVGTIWYEVLGITPQQLKPFDQVKEQVAKSWREEENRTKLTDYTQDLVKSLNDGKSLDDLAKELNTQILPSEPLKRSGITVNVMPAAVSEAFTLPEGGYGSAPSGAADTRIVFQVDKINAPAPIEGPDADRLKEQLNQFVGDDILAEYFAALEKRYGVSINQAALAKLAGENEQP